MSLQKLLNETFGTRKGKPTYLSEMQRLNRNALAKARRLAKTHGISIEHENERDLKGEYWVSCASFEEGPGDPCNGNHFCVGGVEVLQAVEAYVAVLS